MATNTTNLGLIKPAGTDKVRIAQINQNMDIIDEKIGAVSNTSLQAQILAVDSGLAVVSTGNTHVALTSGQYVYIRNHSSLSEGLYKATAAISANATLSTSNVTKLTIGGMNELKSAIDSINSQIVPSSLGSFASISALTSALDTKLSAMGTYTNQEVRFTFSAADGAFRASTLYSGTLCKAGTNDNATLVVSTLSGGGGQSDMVYGQKTTSWRFDAPSMRARGALQSWGTTLTAEAYHIGLLIVNYTAAYTVWFSGTTGINLRSLRGSDGTRSTTEGTITFGADNVDGTGYTITRDGTNITIEATANATMAFLYV